MQDESATWNVHCSLILISFIILLITVHSQMFNYVLRNTPSSSRSEIMNFDLIEVNNGHVYLSRSLGTNYK